MRQTYRNFISRNYIHNQSPGDRQNNTPISAVASPWEEMQASDGRPASSRLAQELAFSRERRCPRSAVRHSAGAARLRNPVSSPTHAVGHFVPALPWPAAAARPTAGLERREHAGRKNASGIRCTLPRGGSNTTIEGNRNPAPGERYRDGPCRIDLPQ